MQKRLELSSSQDAALDLDWSSSLYTAQGLMELQHLYGPVPTIRGIGAGAEAVADNLCRLINAAEEGASALGRLLKFIKTASDFAICVHPTQN